MPIKALPEHGLELSLDEYSKLRAFQGGGWYWDHHHQQTIRECLGEFLPRVEETGAGDRGGALFQHFVGGKEAAASSRPVAAGGDRVPKGELQRLHHALERLKRKAAAPDTDRDARRIIESFALPDPSKDPELYRLYGPPWRRRLLVLWGCEREPGTSVAPFAALNRMPVEPESTTWLRRWPLLLGALLLLLLLLLLAYLLWPQRQNPPASPANAPSGVTAPSTAVPGSLPSASPGASTATDTTTDGTTAATSSASAPVVLPTVDPAAANRPANSSQPSASTAPATKDVPPVVPPPGKEGATNPAAPGMTSDASLPGGATPSRAASRPPAARDSAPTPGEANPSAQSATSNGTRKSSSQPSTSTGPGATAPSPAGVSEIPPASSVRPGAGSPKINVTASSAPRRDGKVDASLAATAEGANKEALPFSVTEWRIDGNPPPDTSKHAAGDNHLKLSLPEGAHRVRVSGATNGSAMTTEVEMDVQIHSQSDVKVKPGPTP